MVPDGMVSAVVLATDSARPAVTPEALVRTLAALVPAVVEGVLGDLVLAGRPGDRDLQRIADHAGCDVVEAEGADLLGRALAAVRGPQVLVLLGGEVPGDGFVEELGDFAADGVGAARLRRRPSGLVERLAPGLAPVTGVYIDRGRLAPDKAPASLADLSRVIGRAADFTARTRPLV